MPPESPKSPDRGTKQVHLSRSFTISSPRYSLKIRFTSPTGTLHGEAFADDDRTAIRQPHFSKTGYAARYRCIVRVL
jgi:hypothetical protein